MQNSPKEITAKYWIDGAWSLSARVNKRRLYLLVAGVALYGLLSLFAAIAASLAIVGLLFDPTMLLEQSEFLLGAMPDAAAEIMAAELSEIVGQRTEPLG